MSNYKRLTERRNNLIIDNCGNCPNVRNPQGCTDAICYEIIRNRLAELEDKIENGTLIFIDEPFWSDYHDCWAVFQRTEDIIQTCYMTVNQAKDYKNRKDVGGDTE